MVNFVPQKNSSMAPIQKEILFPHLQRYSLLRTQNMSVSSQLIRLNMAITGGTKLPYLSLKKYLKDSS